MKNSPRRQTMEKGKKCENNEGFCRNKCKAQEVELRYCFSGKMCCISSYSTLITYVEEETVNMGDFRSTLSQHVY
uniref:Beta-defensin n=1 Tax=Moschus moschiferus TaxID=68415 RepID=A0A8C6E4M9_MOSMO